MFQFQQCDSEISLKFDIFLCLKSKSAVVVSLLSPKLYFYQNFHNWYKIPTKISFFVLAITSRNFETHSTQTIDQVVWVNILEETKRNFEEIRIWLAFFHFQRPLFFYEEFCGTKHDTETKTWQGNITPPLNTTFFQTAVSANELREITPRASVIASITTSTTALQATSSVNLARLFKTQKLNLFNASNKLHNLFVIFIAVIILTNYSGNMVPKEL